MKKNIWKRKEISLLLPLSFLNPKIPIFIGNGGGNVFAERDVTEEGSQEKMLQSVMVGGRWVNKSNFRVR